MFDPFNQAKLQNAYKNMQNFNPGPEKEMTLDDLKRLSGNGKVNGEYTYIPNHVLAAEKAQYIRDNNIKPGDKEWFKVMFAKPDLTGESPFSKK